MHPPHMSAAAVAPWMAVEKYEWLASCPVTRSYHDEVVEELYALDPRYYEVAQYGELSVDPARYPLYAVRTRGWAASKPSILVTGGVHGCETSGVHGAILFLREAAAAYGSMFNILVAPCLSPWSYETRQRWNPDAVDPNRSFSAGGELVEGRLFNPEAATEESEALLELLDSLGVSTWACHMDLHETFDAAAPELQAIRGSRAVETLGLSSMPDGFYLVSDAARPHQMEWHSAITDAVSRVTPIATRWNGAQSSLPASRGATKSADFRARHREARATGSTLQVAQEGVLAIPSTASIGMCAGATNAEYATTTEVYRRHDNAEQCNRAQLAAVVGAIEHIAAAKRLRPSEPPPMRPSPWRLDGSGEEHTGEAGQWSGREREPEAWRWRDSSDEEREGEPAGLAAGDPPASETAMPVIDEGVGQSSHAAVPAVRAAQTAAQAAQTAGSSRAAEAAWVQAAQAAAARAARAAAQTAQTARERAWAGQREPR